MSDGILFDNILVTHDRSVADDFAERTWKVKYAAEKKKHDLEHPIEAVVGVCTTSGSRSKREREKGEGREGVSILIQILYFVLLYYVTNFHE